jgi:hypothetical protein
MRQRRLMVQESAAAQAHFAFLVDKRSICARFFRFLAATLFRFIRARATRDAQMRRQYFLKLEAVFFNALVYSGCSAFRFPNARNSD